MLGGAFLRLAVAVSIERGVGAGRWVRHVELVEHILPTLREGKQQPTIVPTFTELRGGFDPTPA